MPILRSRETSPSEPEMQHHGQHAAEDNGIPRTDAMSSPMQSLDEQAAPDDLLSRASSISRPASPPIQPETSRHKRFSILRFRNASDSQLSLRAKQQAEKPPPIPRRMYLSERTLAGHL